MPLLSILLPLAAGGHPWHRSLAEVDVRREPPRLEVALRVDAFELEEHLRASGDPALSLDRPDEAAARVERLLRSRFLVRSAGGDCGRLRYLGLEADARDAWLYFEITLPPGPGPLELSNQVLFDRNRYQENLLFMRGEDLGLALECRPTRPWVAVAGIDLPDRDTARIGWSVRRPPTPGTRIPSPPTAALGPLGPF